MEAVAAGDKVAIEAVVFTVVAVDDIRRVAVDVVQRHVFRFVNGDAAGGGAGSTGGGLKVSRVVILMRAAKAELRKILHPHTVKVITVDGKPVSGETVRAVSTYFILYVLIAAASVLLGSLDGYDASTTLTAVLATFNNIGPGLGLCGPAGNFAFFSPLAKVVLCIDMLLGRLEMLSFMALLTPAFWRR